MSLAYEILERSCMYIPKSFQERDPAAQHAVTNIAITAISSGNNDEVRSKLKPLVKRAKVRSIPYPWTQEQKDTLKRCMNDATFQKFEDKRDLRKIQKHLEETCPQVEIPSRLQIKSAIQIIKKKSTLHVERELSASSMAQRAVTSVDGKALDCFINNDGFRSKVKSLVKRVKVQSMPYRWTQEQKDTLKKCMNDVTFQKFKNKKDLQRIQKHLEETYPQVEAPSRSQINSAIQVIRKKTLKLQVEATGNRKAHENEETNELLNDTFSSPNWFETMEKSSLFFQGVVDYELLGDV